MFAKSSQARSTLSTTVGKKRMYTVIIVVNVTDIYTCHYSETGMGKICKWRQLNEMKWHEAIWDLSFYETRWILSFSFKHHFNEGDWDFLNIA